MTGQLGKIKEEGERLLAEYDKIRRENEWFRGFGEESERIRRENESLAVEINAGNEKHMKEIENFKRRITDDSVRIEGLTREKDGLRLEIEAGNQKYLKSVDEIKAKGKEEKMKLGEEMERYRRENEVLRGEIKGKEEIMKENGSL